MTSPQAGQILIVDDEPAIRAGLAKLLTRRGFTVVGQAASVPEALKLTTLAAADAAFVDLYLPGFHGLNLIEELLQIRPGLKIIVYTAHDDEYFALRALRAGACGFISKSEPADHAVLALKTVFSGQIYLEEAMRSRLLALVANTPEIEIRGLFGEGGARPAHKQVC